MAAAYETTLRNQQLNVVRDRIDAGTGSGSLVYYDGTRPATGGAATNVLASQPLPEPVAADAAGGVLTFDPVSDVNATGDGTCTWARVLDGDGNFVMDLDVGLSGSGADIIVNTTTFSSAGGGSNVSVASATITRGNA